MTTRLRAGRPTPIREICGLSIKMCAHLRAGKAGVERMSQDHQCRQEGCSLASMHFQLINGAPYCGVHYQQILVERLHAAYGRWTREDRLSPDD